MAQSSVLTEGYHIIAYRWIMSYFLQNYDFVHLNRKKLTGKIGRHIFIGTTQRMPKKLLDQLSDALRMRHYSYRTEETYIDWVRRYILFHQKRHPESMGAEEIQAFITHLATDRKVAASTQNQALSAI